MTNLRDARLRRGWTLTILAEQCRKAGTSVSNGELSKVERGLHVPRPALRKVLADVFSLDIDEFNEEEANAV